MNLTQIFHTPFPAIEDAVRSFRRKLGVRDHPARCELAQHEQPAGLHRESTCWGTTIPLIAHINASSTLVRAIEWHRPLWT